VIRSVHFVRQNEVLGAPRGYHRDHGIHLVWGFYDNLREFMRRHGWGLLELPRDLPVYLFRDKRGTRSELTISDWPRPFARSSSACSPRSAEPSCSLQLEERERST
jgi:hypothetical protein